MVDRMEARARSWVSEELTWLKNLSAKNNVKGGEGTCTPGGVPNRKINKERVEGQETWLWDSKETSKRLSHEKVGGGHVRLRRGSKMKNVRTKGTNNSDQ